jgi:enoyl-CoA hydratase
VEQVQEKELMVEVGGAVGRFTLNRPKALNALTLDQIHEMDPTLRRWATDDEVKMVVVRGKGGRAFCAGGDIRTLFERRKAGDLGYFADFYWAEYRLNHLIKHYTKPYIAILDGIVMGGGVGISVHGSHRIATENTLFAMPETGIGMFPDVGGTFFLPRLPGQIGIYLGLTGARLKPADCLYAGVCTHFVPAQRLIELQTALSEASEGSAADLLIDAFAEEPAEEPPLAQVRDAVDRCFGGGSVEAILAALDAEGGEWAAETKKILLAKSPTALKVAHRQLRLGAALPFDEAMKVEYRLSQRFMAGHEFFEGVRALIIDKDNAPRWQPGTIEEVSAAEVDAMFKPLPSRELQFD